MTSKYARAALMSLLALSGTAWAAGDLPTPLSKRAATNVYKSIKPLLTNDGMTCPAGQTPMSGMMTGGSAPGTGSRTTTLIFSGGAKVVIIKSWDLMSRTAKVEVTCS